MSFNINTYYSDWEDLEIPSYDYDEVAEMMRREVITQMGIPDELLRPRRQTKSKPKFRKVSEVTL